MLIAVTTGFLSLLLCDNIALEAKKAIAEVWMKILWAELS